MPAAPAEFAARLLTEAQESHPCCRRAEPRAGAARRPGAALKIIARVAVTDEEQKRGLLALRRAHTVRHICADGMYEAFVAR